MKTRPSGHHNLLRSLRRRLGLTQEELAHLVGYQTDTQISRLETGRRIPLFIEALAIELICGHEIRSIFQGQSDAVRKDVIARVENLCESLGSRRSDRRMKYKRARLCVRHAIVISHSAAS